MTGAALGTAIKSAVQAAAGVTLGTKDNQIYDAIGNAIVTYIQANAQVPAGIAVSTTGTAAAQTGATTAPGTIT